MPQNKKIIYIGVSRVFMDLERAVSMPSFVHYQTAPRQLVQTSYQSSKWQIVLYFYYNTVKCARGMNEELLSFLNDESTARPHHSQYLNGVIMSIVLNHVNN